MNGNAPTLISGVPNVACLGGHDQVARERDPERSGEHVSARGAQRGLAEPDDQLEQRHEAIGAEVLVHERHVGGEAAKVGAGGEDRLVRGGEHDHAHGVVVAGALETGDQAAEHLGRQRVARRGLVERDRRDAIRDLIEDHPCGGRLGCPLVRPRRAQARTGSARCSQAHPNQIGRQ